MVDGWWHVWVSYNWRRRQVGSHGGRGIHGRCRTGLGTPWRRCVSRIPGDVVSRLVLVVGSLQSDPRQQNWQPSLWLLWLVRQWLDSIHGSPLTTTLSKARARLPLLGRSPGPPPAQLTSADVFLAFPFIIQTGGPSFAPATHRPPGFAHFSLLLFDSLLPR